MVLCQTIFSSESFSYVVEIDKRETQEEELKVRLDKGLQKTNAQLVGCL